MALTEQEQLLVAYLELFGVSEGMAVAIFMTVHERALEMCRYMEENLKASEEELLDEARRIMETEE